jgi:glycosyltransferase involved in cell wall biosynthesis
MACSFWLFLGSIETLKNRLKVKSILQNIETSFLSGKWFSAGKVKRSFVKHSILQASPGKVWHYQPDRTSILLSVVIPTIDANRGGYFPQLLAQIGRQDFEDLEVIIVRGDPRQGRAINTAAVLARGKYFLTLDDDTSLPDPTIFRKLIAVMKKHSEIGIAGGNNTIPADADPFIRRAMNELPRRSWDPVKNIIDSDLAEHPCMIMRTEEFQLVGGENELIPRGLDPYLRQEFRNLGKRVVVIPEAIYHHLPPENFNKLMHQFYRNGRQAAFTNRNYPQWVIETPNYHGEFVPQKSFLYRIFRYLCDFLKTILNRKWILLSSKIAYAAGFVMDAMFSRR